MKKLLITILSVVMLFSITMFATGCELFNRFKPATEGLDFRLINNDTEYEVIGYTGTSTEVYIPLTYNGKPVTSIGQRAFNCCTSLKSIVISDSVISIGDGAFYYCLSLTSIVIPESVTSIGSSAFDDCSFLTSIEISNSVTSIGSNAFEDCSSLQYNVKDGLKYLGNKENKYLYLAGVESQSITIATIDSNCRFIGENALFYCDSLTSVVIPNSVTSIGYRAFSTCTSLTSIVIPDGVTSIGYSAFDGCSSLTTIYCEAQSQPSGWDSYWKDGCSAQVVWGYTGD